MAELRRFRPLRLLAGPLAIASGAACAEPVTVASGNEAVDRFVRAVEAGDPGAAAQIRSMESLTGVPNAAATPQEMVAKLAACDFVSVQERRLAGAVYDVRWHCPDGDYYSLLDPGYRPPRVTVGEFVTAGSREARRRSIPHPPAPPAPPPSPPVKSR
jgi:hypothetical protein